MLLYIAPAARSFISPCNTGKCSVNAMIIKIINKLSSLPTPKYYYISKAWIGGLGVGGSGEGCIALKKH